MLKALSRGTTDVFIYMYVYKQNQEIRLLLGRIGSVRLVYAFNIISMDEKR
jgi:hypothetical protein